MDRPLHTPAPFRPPQRKSRLSRSGTVDRRRAPWFAGAASAGLHLLVAALLLLLMRPRPPVPADQPTGAVELLMVEKKGSGEPVPLRPTQTQTPPRPVPPQPAPPQSTGEPPAPEPQQKQAAADDAASASSAAAVPSRPDEAGEPLPPPPPAPVRQEAKAAPQQEAKATETPKTQAPAQPPPPDPLVFNLDGTDSESNAIVMGKQVLPASPDDRFRNRPPIYPYDAVIRGQHGAVLLIIHVAGDGRATGADVQESSGVPSLDRAALDAVVKWHFRPAMKDGQVVPFDMPMRFIFQSE